MTTKGHLFVVHGRIEAVVHDAAIIPVDRALKFEEYWQALLPDNPQAPTGWGRQGWGRLSTASESRTWLVEVGADDYEGVISRVTRTLNAIAEVLTPPNFVIAGRREVPLVAMPVVGVGAGGHDHERGRSIKELVSRLTDFSAQQGIDIALVTPNPSVYAAAQFVRRGLGRPNSVPEPIEEEAEDLGDKAKMGELALFLGAGVSIPAGLMSWSDLIKKLVKVVASNSEGSRISLKDLDGLDATDQAELIQRQDPQGLQKHVVDLTSKAQRPSLLHALAAGLDVREVVTTNYDPLYERAAKAAGHEVKAVMPWGSVDGAGRWILKLHGDVDHPSQVVLTRRHMVRYDAQNRPSAAMLQTLMLTRHLLFLGTSFTDDNVIRLVHEVQAYRELHARGGAGTEDTTPPKVFGTVIDTDGQGPRKKLWDGQLKRIHHKAGDVSSRRAVELLLDRAGISHRTMPLGCWTQGLQSCLLVRTTVTSPQKRSICSTGSLRATNCGIHCETD